MNSEQRTANSEQRTANSEQQDKTLICGISADLFFFCYLGMVWEKIQCHGARQNSVSQESHTM